MSSRALQNAGRLARHLPQPTVMDGKPRKRDSRCQVAMIGFGTVGQSVAKVLCERGGRLVLTHVCSRSVDRERAPWLPPEVRWTDDVNEVFGADVDVIVELVGGLQPAEDWIRRALENGKSVVTANKQLIAHCGPELAELAHCMGRHFLLRRFGRRRDSGVVGATRRARGRPPAEGARHSERHVQLRPDADGKRGSLI